jgi:deazaflavin-dependent oxidoreductase (nitroreductase family)
MNGNSFMSWVLRSPLHGMLSNGMLLITVKGIKTGKAYTTPVEYYRQDGSLWVMTLRNRTWWKNLRDGAEVSLLLKRKPVLAFAEIDLDEGSVEARLHEYVKYMPHAAKPLDIHVENGIANAEDVARVAKDKLFVRLKLS